ncbi:MAG: hypothetical protein P8175_17710 [Deltaproteobacteria bacterium]|jgi:hypothetical protein
MAIRKDIKSVRGAVLAIGKQIEDKGGGAEKISSYASLVNAYVRLLGTRKTRAKAEYDPDDGDPTYYAKLLESCESGKK